MPEQSPSFPHNTSAASKRLPPVPSRSNLRELVRDPLRFFVTLAAEYGDIVCYRPAPDPAYLINHPDYVRHVLVDNNRNYSKATSSNLAFRKVVGDGLLTSEGETWRRQRRLMQPAFHHARIEPLDGMIIQSTDELLQKWEEDFAAGRPIDIAREMAALTLTITTRALFGVAVGEEARAIGETVNRAATVLERPSDKQLQQSRSEMHAVVDRIIEQRRQDFRDGGDLLSSMMLTHDGQVGQGMTDEELRNQVMTLMLAGYETTANALSWTWYLLALHPSSAERLRHEVSHVLEGRNPIYGDLASLPYTRMVLEESLRMYPPAWTLGRRALGEDEIGGYHVAPGTVIAICIYALHRHPGFWVEPDSFDPERFAPSSVRGRHKFAYIPFGAGPRQCIGNNFGLMEASLIIARIAQRFSLQLMPGVQAQPQAVFVLRSGGDLMMRLRR